MDMMNIFYHTLVDAMPTLIIVAAMLMLLEIVAWITRDAVVPAIKKTLNKPSFTGTSVDGIKLIRLE